MANRAIYPGSFDPVTHGHLDVIKRASRIFDEVIVAVAHNTYKQPIFNRQERLEMLQQATKGLKGVVVESFEGLVVEYARQKKCNVLIRGIRMMSDFENELQMALTNRRLDEHLETVFLMPSEGYSFLSSTLLKEAATLGADVASFVPEFIGEKLKKRLQEKK